MAVAEGKEKKRNRKSMAVAEVEEEAEEKRKNKKQQRFDEPRGSLENIPSELVMEILPHLPLKSLLRLILSSKPLSPLVSEHVCDRYSLPRAASGIFFSRPISETPTKNFYHPLDNSSSKSEFIDGTLSTFPSTPDDDLVVVDSCNGLLLCRRQKVNQGYQVILLFVCNPLTGQCTSIPIPNTFLMFREAVLAFDPHVSGHYNLLRFCSGSIDVFSSETGSWVNKKQGASHRAREGEARPFFFKGKVYLPSYKLPFVKVFDREGKSFGKINLPQPELSNSERLLGYRGGHLHCAVRLFDKMSIWILVDRNESRWILKHTISVRSIFDDAGFPNVWYRARAFHPDMDVIFIQVNDKLFSYNMDNGDLTEVCMCMCSMCPWFQESSIFVYSPCYSKDFDL